MDLQERILDRVARLFFVAKDAEGEAVGASLIALDQHAKRLLISLASQGYRVAIAHSPLCPRSGP